MTGSFWFDLLLARVRWLGWRAALVLSALSLLVAGTAIGVHAGELAAVGSFWIVACGWQLLTPPKRPPNDAPPAVRLALDQADIPLLAAPGRQGLTARLLRWVLAPRLTVSERGLVLSDRRGRRVIDIARVKSVDWSVTGIDLELTSGERLSLKTFSPPSAFGLADRSVSRLVRAATFQAMALSCDA